MPKAQAPLLMSPWDAPWSTEVEDTSHVFMVPANDKEELSKPQWESLGSHCQGHEFPREEGASGADPT